MTKTELGKIITNEAAKRGYEKMIFNPEAIVKLEQSAYMVQRNCLGMKMYALWYEDKAFILSVWANGTTKLTVLTNVIMSTTE